MSQATSSPEDFLRAVKEAVLKHVQDEKATMLKELQENNDDFAGVPEKRLREICDSVVRKTERSLRKNLEKFEIYAARNIFVPAAPSSSQSSSSRAPSTDTDEQLQNLRVQYLTLQSELLSLLDSCRDTDLLLKDMRSALFTLRVGAQAFDEGDIQPIAETVANITQNREKLLKMCDDANEILVSLDENKRTGETSADAAGGEAMDVVEGGDPGNAVIETQDLDDILMVGKSLRK